VAKASSIAQYRISLEELKTRAAAGLLAKEAQRLYFKPDREKSKAFSPALRLNANLVDTGGRTVATEEVADIIKLAVKAENARLIAGASTEPSLRLKLLGEGDSWFRLPMWPWPPTAIDILCQDYEQYYEVLNLAMWGDTIEEMIQAKEYEKLLRSGRYRHFLFSGGGNDVLGSIRDYVKTRTSGDTDPSNAPCYVRPKYKKKIEEIIAQYAIIADQVKAWAPTGSILYVHGYANAIPRRNGQFLGTPLASRGFDPVGPLAKAIIAHMVGLFNRALESFAAGKANVVYVDLRPEVNASDWSRDEIHPSERGARKIAAAFSAAVSDNKPIS
jgi:hypothetical protein